MIDHFEDLVLHHDIAALSFFSGTSLEGWRKQLVADLFNFMENLIIDEVDLRLFVLLLLPFDQILNFHKQLVRLCECPLLHEGRS
jgi:hypothetical protein